MKSLIKIAVLLGAAWLFQSCSEPPLTEAQIEAQVVEFLESRNYPDPNNLEITLQWREQDEVWFAEVVPKAEYRAEAGDWNWPVEIIVSPAGTIVGVQ